ncbi:glycine betaine ABC transporter substrate-binding protein [Gudongella oleilytica]|uniref:glycine betaine ABC transporter substrate-binding protein n=1 Tax=Gudongella oleilytica TaxID=1582259 RepID=UPI0013E8CCCF|nr:glycine betaine ABC transporter substrate-binding protein [Gudongella oleilytica]
MKKLSIITIMIISAAMLLSSCAPETSTEVLNKDDPIIVGSFVDTEGGILGNMILLTLEKNGYAVTDKVQFGTPDVHRNALIAGELQVGIDYTGNGQFYSEGIAEEVWNDAEEGYEAIASYDKENNGLIWLKPAKANNTEAIAMTKSFAEENGIEDMYDFADYVNSEGVIKFITSQLFAEKYSGLLGMEEAYGFKLKPEQVIMLPHGNTAETISALANGTDDVNAALVYGTDGSLAELELVVIEDPLSIPPVYEPSAIIRSDVLDKYPEIGPIIEDVFETLDLETLQLLNKKVIVDGLSPREVAEEHLINEGILE